MNMTEYLDKVEEQVRCKQARVGIREELQNHVEDQKEYYIQEGLSEEGAVKKAVLDMGDPVEVGVSMDRIHRPKMEWRMIFFVVFLTVLGLLFQLSIGRMTGDMTALSRKKIGMTLVGLGTMLLICRIDYSSFLRFSRPGAILVLLIPILSVPFGDYWVKRTIAQESMYLYIPFYGGILFFYRKEGKKGLIKSVLWMLPPIVIAFRLPGLSLAGSLCIVMAAMLSYAVWKGWFGVGKKVVAGIWGGILALPLLTFGYYMFFGFAYQKARMKAWLGVTADSAGAGYSNHVLRETLGSSRFLGSAAMNEAGKEVIKEYVFSSLISYYGILAAVLVLILLVYFVFRMFRISIRQKNQLGMMAGMGCSLVFTLRILMAVCINLTILPATYNALPFFSDGYCTAFVNYMLLGILLSICTYQNVLPAEPEWRVRIHG